MSLGSKTIKIGELDVNIIQFNALEALQIRKKIVETLKKQLGDISLEDATTILKSLASLVYEIPEDLFLELFKNCSAIEIGGLNDKTNFNQVFNSNLDGIIELAMEVIQYNGFFSLNTISIITKKIPALASMEKALMTTIKEMKN